MNGRRFSRRPGNATRKVSAGNFYRRPALEGTPIRATLPLGILRRRVAHVAFCGTIGGYGQAPDGILVESIRQSRGIPAPWGTRRLKFAPISVKCCSEIRDFSDDPFHPEEDLAGRATPVRSPTREEGCDVPAPRFSIRNRTFTGRSVGLSLHGRSGPRYKQKRGLWISGV